MDKYVFNNTYSYDRRFSINNVLDDFNKLKLQAAENSYEALDAMIDISDAIEKLKTINDKQYTCINMYYRERYTQRQISELLQITQSTVAKHLQNGIQNIRVLLIGQEKVNEIDNEFQKVVDAHKVADRLRGVK